MIVFFLKNHWYFIPVVAAYNKNNFVVTNYKHADIYTHTHIILYIYKHDLKSKQSREPILNSHYD